MNASQIVLIVFLAVFGYGVLTLVIFHLVDLHHKKVLDKIIENCKFFKDVKALNQKYSRINVNNSHNEITGFQLISNYQYIISVGQKRPSARDYSTAIKIIFTDRRDIITKKLEEQHQLKNIFKEYNDEFDKLINEAKAKPNVFFAIENYEDGKKNLSDLKLDFEIYRLRKPNFSFYVVVSTDYAYANNKKFNGKILDEKEIVALLAQYSNYGNTSFEKYTKKEEFDNNKANINYETAYKAENLKDNVYKPNFVFVNNEKISESKKSDVKLTDNKLSDQKTTVSSREEKVAKSFEKISDVSKDEPTIRNQTIITKSFNEVYAKLLKYGIDKMFKSCKLYNEFETIEKFDFNRNFMEYKTLDLKRDRFILLYSLILTYGSEIDSGKAIKNLFELYNLKVSDMQSIKVFSKINKDFIKDVDINYCNIANRKNENVEFLTTDGIDSLLKIINLVKEYILDYYPIDSLDYKKVTSIKGENYLVSIFLNSKECFYQLDLSSGNISEKIKTSSVFNYYLARKSDIYNSPKNIAILRPFCNQIITYKGTIVETYFFNRLDDVL